jgi:hypothetical protein
MRASHCYTNAERVAASELGSDRLRPSACRISLRTARLYPTRSLAVESKTRIPLRILKFRALTSRLPFNSQAAAEDRRQAPVVFDEL